MGLQEVSKLPSNMVAHVMYWATFTPTARPAAGVGLLIRWHLTFQQIGRDVHPSGRAPRVPQPRRTHFSFGGLLPCQPRHQRGAKPPSMGFECPSSTQRGRHPATGGPQRQPGLGGRLPHVPCRHHDPWDDFLRDTGLSRGTPRVEVPTWVDARGCVGVIDHILRGGGGLRRVLCGWTRPRLSRQITHRPVIWDAWAHGPPQEFGELQ